MKKLFSVVFIAILFALTFVSCTKTTAPTSSMPVSSSPSSSTVLKEPVAELTAEELVEAYTQDAEKADANYGGEALQITGTLAYDPTAYTEQIVLRLSAGDSTLECLFDVSQKDDLMLLKAGSTLTFIGQCKTITSGCNVQNCVFA